MKKIAAIIILILSFCGFSSCEKDDICAEGTSTTPRLVIEFYNSRVRDTLKSVTNLKVIGEGMANGVVFNESVTTDAQYLSNGNKIYLPLKLDAETVTYSFILNFGNTDSTLVFTDKLQFNYMHKNIYVSRACGYKMLFDLNNGNGTLPNPLVLNDNPATNTGNWISDIEVVKYNLENEDETHLKIYF